VGSVLLLVLSFLLLWPELINAQAPIRIPRDRPSERPFEPPPRPEEQPEEPQVTPAPLPPESIPDSLAAGSVWVDDLALSGNEVISDATLLAAAHPFLGRHLSPTSLQQLVVTLTQVYVDAGYANSGAVLPDQQVHDGVLAVDLVEGRLGAVQIVGARTYRPRVLEDRLRHSIREPLRVQQIEQALRLLEGDHRIRRLDARLVPTDVRGVARLVVRVEEQVPWWLTLGGDNYEPESVGTGAGRASAGDDNLLGFGDDLRVDVTATEGMWQLASSYQIPVHASGTTLGVEGWGSRADVVQNPFDQLDVESDAYTLGATLDQPLLQTPAQDLSAGLRFEYRWGKTSLLGRGFTFEPGADDGEVKITVLRPLLEWTSRGESYALATRSLFSIGLDLPGTTEHSGETPDGQFFAWLGQIRGIYREDRTQISLHARLDVQLSSVPLLPLEQFAVGGPDSVRGYPTNFLVRDQAVQGSIEARWPAWTWNHGRHRVELASFFDAGHAWNRDRPSPGRDTLYGVGVGLHVLPFSTLELGVEWAYALRDVQSGSSLQGRGLLLSVRWGYPW
jgi:hemolysin activation/secretion protein